MLLGDSDGLVKKNKGARLTIKEHKEVEVYLGRYSGLILYLKEMDEISYAKLCAVRAALVCMGSCTDAQSHFRRTSHLRASCTARKSGPSWRCIAGWSKSPQKRTPIKVSKLAIFKNKPPAHSHHSDFTVTPSGGGNRTANPLRRAGTLVRSPLESRRDRGDKHAEGDMEAAEAFGRILEAMAPQIYREQEFIADFLQINEAGLTFADYMGLENYFRRQAARTIGMSQQTLKLIRGAMELIFGFLPLELKAWIDGALAKDNLYVRC